MSDASRWKDTSQRTYVYQFPEIKRYMGGWKRGHESYLSPGKLSFAKRIS